MTLSQAWVHLAKGGHIQKQMVYWHPAALAVSTLAGKMGRSALCQAIKHRRIVPDLSIAPLRLSIMFGQAFNQTTGMNMQHPPLSAVRPTVAMHDVRNVPVRLV